MTFVWSVQVPFVLKQGAQQSKSDYLVVNLEGSKHPLPLITVSHVMQPITATPYTLMQAIFGREYAVSCLLLALFWLSTL